MVLIAACALFGFSVGNLITLPSLIVQREFDPRSFGVLISLITAINQITYAFGPGVIGLLRDALGKLYAAVLRLHRAGTDRGRADHDPRKVGVQAKAGGARLHDAKVTPRVAAADRRGRAGA